MPMKSQKQRSFLWAKKPKIAQEFEDKTPKGKKLPKYAPIKGRIARAVKPKHKTHKGK